MQQARDHITVKEALSEQQRRVGRDKQEPREKKKGEVLQVIQLYPPGSFNVFVWLKFGLGAESD